LKSVLGVPDIPKEETDCLSKNICKQLPAFTV